jgi:hypothetical protein
MALLLEIKSGWDGIRDEYLAANGKKPAEQKNSSETSLASYSV